MMGSGQGAWPIRAETVISNLAGRIPIAMPAPAADPARLARDVMHGPDFWWKQLKPGATPETSWLTKLLSPITELLSRLWGFVADVIAWIFRLLGRLAGTGGSGGSIVIWIIAGAIIGWALWKLVPLFFRHAEAPPIPDPTMVGSATLAEAADLRGQAAQALAEKRHAEAIRLALLALIAALEDRGLLRFDPTRTNLEYRAELRPRPELVERFGRLARIYEQVWYGQGSAGREQAEESIRLCAKPIDEEAPSPG